MTESKPQGTPATLGAEEAILEGRRATAARLRARGENPFANDVVPRLSGSETLDLTDLRAAAATAATAGKYDAEKVHAVTAGRTFHVRGRAIAVRSTGGLSFVRLRDRTGELPSMNIPVPSGPVERW